MEKIITFTTKLLEKFVSDLQNDNFANRLKEKAILLDKNMEFAFKKVVLTYKKVVKYSNGKLRVKHFLIDNLDSFEREHKIIVNLIENHNVEAKWDEYTRSKSCISAILRANRRMGLLKITDNDEVKSYINQHICHRRFENRRYKLAT